ncbi:MAG: AI-2E family transporter [Candidatus Woesearchaeota archaeon]
MASNNAKKYMFILLVSLLLVLSYMVIKDLLITILNSFIIVIIFMPIYLWLKKKVKKDIIAAAITTLLIITIITLPLAFMINGLVSETTGIYSMLKDKYSDTDTINFFDKDCDTYLCKINNRADEIIVKYNLKTNLIKSLGEIGKKLSSLSFAFLMKIPAKIINFIIMIILIFFIFIDGEKMLVYIKRAIPLNKKQQKHMIYQIKGTIEAVVYGQIIIAMIQGIVGGIGLYIVGIPNPILLGIIIGILALMPIVGASLVWVPSSLYLILTGISTSDTSLIIKGIVFTIYCFVFLNLIELILKPKIIGEKSSIHPMIILIGILGGIKVFGFSGMVLGPLVLSIMIKLIEFYERE